MHHNTLQIERIEMASKAIDSLLVDFANRRICVQFHRQRGVYFYPDVPAETLDALRVVMSTAPSTQNKRRRLCSYGSWLKYFGVTTLPFQHFPSIRSFESSVATQKLPHSTQSAPRAA